MDTTSVSTGRSVGGGGWPLHVSFAVAGSVVMFVGMIALGWWTSREIEQSVTRNSAISTALYMESFIAPLSQELADGSDFSPETVERLNAAFNEPPLSERIVSVKIWQDKGLIAYATDPRIVGRRFVPSVPLMAAWDGQLSAAFDDLSDEEDAAERGRNLPILEVYNPIHSVYSGNIIAVAEFYQVATELEKDLFRARLKAWVLVAGITLATFALLNGIVLKGSRLIQRQREALELRVAQLASYSAQNEALRRRIQSASAGVSELNEQYLRRVGAELHDGPAQSLAFASLRLDNLKTVEGQEENAFRIKSALDDARAEIRNVCRGLSLPEIEGKDLGDVIRMAVGFHEKRTNSAVELQITGQAGTGFDKAARICIFRFVQEALNNSFRHAGGSGSRVEARLGPAQVTVAVSDTGPGFDPETAAKSLGLGLRGLRERIESQGGHFEIDSSPEGGTHLKMRLLENGGENAG